MTSSGAGQDESNAPRSNATNAMRNQAVRKKMTPCEVVTGKTVEQLDAMHAEQRARVFAKYETKDTDARDDQNQGAERP